MSVFYVAGRCVYICVFLFCIFFLVKMVLTIFFRLWQDAENRVYLINELDKRTGQVFNMHLFRNFT